uniref:Uncharacterized protein n=1 Tax=Oryzias latipes TaxID=8090 RepID=A0A3P9MH47_ORYLA
MKKYCSVTRVIVHPHIWAQISMCLLDKMIDFIGVSKGHGVNKSLRKVACIGSWHPSRVGFTVDRAGETGDHHRTEIHKVCYHPKKRWRRIHYLSFSPQGGFPQFSEVNNDFIMVKGCMFIYKNIFLWIFVADFQSRKVQTRRSCTAREAIELKFIDTTSKFGHWCFLTVQEKRFFKGEEKSHI